MIVPLSVEESTDWLAAGIAIDEVLFSVVGAWSTDEPDPAARVAFATISRWYGEHSRDARALLADSPALDATRRVLVPDDWADRLMVLETAAARGEALTKAVGARRDRDAQITGRLTEVADAPLLRHLARARIDHDRALGLLDHR